MSSIAAEILAESSPLGLELVLPSLLITFVFPFFVLLFLFMFKEEGDANAGVVSWGKRKLCTELRLFPKKVNMSNFQLLCPTISKI